MTNVVNITPPMVEVIDEAYFEKYADAALLLKCFEVVKDVPGLQSVASATVTPASSRRRAGAYADPAGATS